VVLILQGILTTLPLSSVLHQSNPPDRGNEMALQRKPMPTSNTDETGLGSDGRIPNSDESVTLNVVEDEPLGGKEDQTKLGSVTSTLDVDDYPDGGLAAWSVVFGVSLLTDPCLSGLTDSAWSCSLPVPSSRRRSHRTNFVPNH